MARKQSKPLTIKVEIDGVRETLAKLNQLPKEANDAVKDRAGEVAQTLAQHARSSAKGNRQSALMAPTIKVRRDRLPSIIVGGSKKVGSNRVPAYKVLFGSEFGSNRLKQFRPHVGQSGYWFFPTVEDNAREIADAWQKAADDAIDEFSSGGGS